MASIPSGNSLTGKPDAGNPPVRFGGRGGVIRHPYPYSLSKAAPRTQPSLRDLAPLRRIPALARRATFRMSLRDNGSLGKSIEPPLRAFTGFAEYVLSENK